MKYGLTSDRQNSFSGDESVRFSESTGSDLAHIPPIVIVKVSIKNSETNCKNCKEYFWFVKSYLMLQSPFLTSPAHSLFPV